MNRTKQTNIFAGEAHEEFYNAQLAQCRSHDCYHRALIYALGITEDTRRHIAEIYDVKEDRICSGSVHSDWVTGTDARIMRLAFNLFTDNVPEKGKERKYTVGEIFGYSNLLRYFLQAIIIRYE